MHKLLPLLALIVTASISAGRPAAAEGRFAGPLPGPFATDVAGPDATVVFVAGMGGGTTSGGMRGGTTGGMGGSGATGGGMFGTPAPSFGANGSSDWPGNSAQSSYYTYQCATPAGACSFVAPASRRSSSLRAGARCSCAEGQSQGQIK
jgi:hypothetical protein